MEPGLRSGATRSYGKSVCRHCASPPMLRRRAACGRGGGSLMHSAFARRPATCEGAWVQPASVAPGLGRRGGCAGTARQGPAAHLIRKGLERRTRRDVCRTTRVVRQVRMSVLADQSVDDRHLTGGGAQLARSAAVLQVQCAVQHMHLALEPHLSPGAHLGRHGQCGADSCCSRRGGARAASQRARWEWARPQRHRSQRDQVQPQVAPWRLRWRQQRQQPRPQAAHAEAPEARRMLQPRSSAPARGAPSTRTCCSR